MTTQGYTYKPDDLLKLPPGGWCTGYDGSTVRPGPNHSTVEIWFDTEEQAHAARRAFVDLIDAHSNQTAGS